MILPIVPILFILRFIWGYLLAFYGYKRTKTPASIGSLLKKIIFRWGRLPINLRFYPENAKQTIKLRTFCHFFKKCSYSSIFMQIV